MALEAVRVLQFGGVNITIPHKEKVIPYLDQLAGDALLTGSVNTVVSVDGRLIGYSTDGEGFLLSLRNKGRLDPAGKTVVLLGVGWSRPGNCFSPRPAGGHRHPLPGG